MGLKSLGGGGMWQTELQLLGVDFCQRIASGNVLKPKIMRGRNGARFGWMEMMMKCQTTDRVNTHNFIGNSPNQRATLCTHTKCKEMSDSKSFCSAFFWKPQCCSSCFPYYTYPSSSLVSKHESKWLSWPQQGKGWWPRHQHIKRPGKKHHRRRGAIQQIHPASLYSFRRRPAMPVLRPDITCWNSRNNKKLFWMNNCKMMLCKIHSITTTNNMLITPWQQ